ncbi:uncharacterized protein KY384_001469 [Bacidia gigantensis]|uniref:uncharacterized protein n=1 Tax=Bacidia gigantensis TaxID=2732470 RepID=UPI001D04B1AF|nr:uncharacterized protein KY384_001469 [Bacidia gigantensis]KAG8533728.1 hypothetical protein KY384_001469 [Bacidia gigantensis]
MHYSTLVLATFVANVVGHSWIEQLRIIDGSGSFTGQPGYIRAFTPRTAPGFKDTSLVHILPPSDPLEARDDNAASKNYITQGISATDPMCRKSQQAQTQTPGFPRLQAPAGSMVALTYLENGHVTQPQVPPGKPAGSGDVYVYVTSQPKANENFLDVFQKWTEDGTGGDKRGRLVAKQTYDDGRCYQVNGSPISQDRQKQFPHTADPATGTDLACQNDIKLPSDLPAGKPVTVYWVWDWHTEPGAASASGKPEIYTSCLDVDITSSSKPRSLKIRGDPANYNNQAIPKYLSAMAAPSAAATAPAASPAPSNPAPQSPAAANGPAPTSAQAQNPPSQPSAAAPSAQVGSNDVAALKAQIVSQVVAELKTAAPTVTVTDSQAAAPAAASSQAPPANNAQAVASQVPQSMILASPMMNPTISPAQPAFSGTASPAPPSATGAVSGATHYKRCQGDCRKIKRSRIFNVGGQ